MPGGLNGLWKVNDFACSLFILKIAQSVVKSSR